VADGVEVSPVRKRYGPEAATGRGLLLIERMAAAWGTEPSGAGPPGTPGPPGKVVWFELAAGAGNGPDVALDADTLADLADLGGHDRREAGGPAHRRGFRGPRTRTRRPYPPHLRRGARR
jgi:hypothetical protein